MNNSDALLREYKFEHFSRKKGLKLLREEMCVRLGSESLKKGVSPNAELKTDSVQECSEQLSLDLGYLPSKNGLA